MNNSTIVTELPPLNIQLLQDYEEQLYEALVVAEKAKARPDAEAVKTRSINIHASNLAREKNIPEAEAIKIVRERHEGTLHPGDMIFFQDYGAVSIEEILKDRRKYDQKSCRDPLEPGEGSSRAMFFSNEGKGAGKPVINSFLHGGQVYHIIDPGGDFKDIGSTDVIFKKTPGEVIHELSDILQEKETISTDEWFRIINTACLQDGEVDEVLDYLTTKKVGKKRFLKKDYQRLKAKAESENAKDKLKEMAGNRSIVKYNEFNLNKTARQTEQGVINIPGDWLYFNFGGLLSYATYDTLAGTSTGLNDKKPPKVPVIKPYNNHNLQLRIEQSVLHYNESKDKETGEKVPYPIPTPMQVVLKIAEHPSPLAPRVSGLVSHPVVDLNGGVINTEGINEKTGLLLQFGGTEFPPLPQNLSQADAAQAAKEIFEDLFSEFNFKNNPITRLFPVAAIGFLQTCVERKLLDQAPGIKVVANVQGSGKTTLARIVHVVVTGSDMPVNSLGGNPEEQKKEMLASLLQNPALLVYDNVLDGSEVRDPIIAKVITASLFKNRILGKSQEVSVPTNTVFCLTGNNITLSSDLVRRFITIALTVDNEKPESRIFKNSDVVQHCLNLREKSIRN